MKPRIVEQDGVPIRAIIYKKFPAGTDECGKTDCPVCISGKAKMKNYLKVTPGGAGYVIRYTTCKEQQINAVYHGETGRTLYSRLTEHMKGHQKKQEGNPLHKTR